MKYAVDKYEARNRRSKTNLTKGAFGKRKPYPKYDGKVSRRSKNGGKKS